MLVQHAIPSAAAASAHGNRRNNRTTGRRALRRRSSLDASPSQDNRVSHDFPPSSPISMANTTSPISTPNTSPPETPVAGPSTPVRTPKANRHRRKPYDTPVPRDHDSSWFQNEGTSKRVDIDLTLDSEDDGLPISGPSRQSTTGMSPKQQAPVLHVDEEIIEISD